jgi:general secretion pathway protein G
MKTCEPTDLSCSRKLAWKEVAMNVPGPVTTAGFSLIELIVIVTVLGVLVILAIPSYNKLVETAKVGRCTTEIRVLEKDINAYFIDRNALPGSLNDIGRGDLRDPWGNLYRYLNIADGGVPPRSDVPFDDLNKDFDLYSVGPDSATLPDIKEAVSLDDVVRAGDGGWVGLGKDF